jgi:hypothetical protein
MQLRTDADLRLIRRIDKQALSLSRMRERNPKGG